MEIELTAPTNWYVISFSGGNLFVNYQERLLSIEPPFRFKDLPSFLANYNLSCKRKEIYESIICKFEECEKALKEHSERHKKLIETIPAKDKEEKDIVEEEQLRKELELIIKSNHN